MVWLESRRDRDGLSLLSWLNEEGVVSIVWDLRALNNVLLHDRRSFTLISTTSVISKQKRAIFWWHLPKRFSLDSYPIRQQVAEPRPTNQRRFSYGSVRSNAVLLAFLRWICRATTQTCKRTLFTYGWRIASLRSKEAFGNTIERFSPACSTGPKNLSGVLLR